VLWHEFCHVVTLQMTRNRMPRWLSEGISVYEELQANPVWGQTMNPQYREMVLGDDLTPVSELSSAFMSPKSDLHVQFAYYQSSLVVEYLVDKFGFEKLKAILHDLGEGVDINEAIPKHTAPLKQIEKEFAAFATAKAEALGPENVIGVRMPYRTSSAESLDHAQLVGDALGLALRTVDISAGVDGLVAAVGSESPARKGNIMARARMITLFDLSAELVALPIGTGNKSERLLGYFTWHADDSPPVNPIGDLFKSQVWALARHLGVPGVIVDKPATADLVQGQTDEADFGVSYAHADQILHWLLSGYGPGDIASLGYPAEEIALVKGRLESTHWKRRLPTVAMVSQTAIGEYYLRPVDY